MISCFKKTNTSKRSHNLFFQNLVIVFFCLCINEPKQKEEIKKKETIRINRILPSTGQTLCYNDEGKEIPCWRKEFPGQDGFYQSGYPIKERFIDNGDGTVTDKFTNLMWQQEVEDLNPPKNITSKDCMNWKEALQYCENLNLAGYNDWKLPNVSELFTLVNYGLSTPAIDPVFESGNWHYWSSTTPPWKSKYCVTINFAFGIVFSMSSKKKINNCYAKAVREIDNSISNNKVEKNNALYKLPSTGQTLCYDDEGKEIPCYSKGFPGQDGFYQSGYPIKERFIDNGDGTVTDKFTGLMWQKKAVDINGDQRITEPEDCLSWKKALQYCENLEFAGYTDWKLPNIVELHSIVDLRSEKSGFTPKIERQSLIYWSSTSVTGLSSDAWITFKHNCDISYTSKKSKDIHVRPVRIINK